MRVERMDCNFTCVLNKDFKVMSSTNTHKEQFYSKLKNIKKSKNRPIIREHLKFAKKCLSNQHQQNFGCDDDVDDVVKRIKKRIKRNKFTLVNM